MKVKHKKEQEMRCCKLHTGSFGLTFLFLFYSEVDIIHCYDMNIIELNCFADYFLKVVKFGVDRTLQYWHNCFTRKGLNTDWNKTQFKEHQRLPWWINSSWEGTHNIHLHFYNPHTSRQRMYRPYTLFPITC